jgi:hypothetical protein
MKRLLVLAFLLAASPAFAGTVVIQITDPTINGGTPISKTFSVSSADFATWAGAYQSPCNVSINGTCTALQVWNFAAVKAAQMWISDVKSLTTPAPSAGTSISVQ